MPDGKLILWQRIEKIGPGDENFHLILAKIFPGQIKENISGPASEGKHLSVISSRSRSIAVRYLGETGREITTLVVDDSIGNYDEFVELVYQGFKKHKQNSDF